MFILGYLSWLQTLFAPYLVESNGEQSVDTCSRRWTTQVRNSGGSWCACWENQEEPVSSECGDAGCATKIKCSNRTGSGEDDKFWASIHCPDLMWTNWWTVKEVQGIRGGKDQGSWGDEQEASWDECKAWAFAKSESTRLRYMVCWTYPFAWYAAAGAATSFFFSLLASGQCLSLLASGQCHLWNEMTCLLSTTIDWTATCLLCQNVNLPTWNSYW